MRRLVFADDLFQLSKVPLQKTVHVVKKAIENLSGCKFQDCLHLFPIDTFSSNALKIFVFAIGDNDSLKLKRTTKCLDVNCSFLLLQTSLQNT